MHTIWSGNIAKDIASDLTEFEHMLHAPFPDIPVGVIQRFPSLSDHGAFTNGDLSD